MSAYNTDGSRNVTIVANNAATNDIGGVAGINGTAATTTQTSSDLTNTSARGIKVVLDMTAVGTGSVTLSIKGKDKASGKYYTILAGAAVTTNSTNVYTVYPGLTASANVTTNDVLPNIYQILVTANNANPTTYTVGACLLP